MASEKIVLFDIPTREPHATWSPNGWKTRLLLNFKGLDYATQWVEYPDIKSTLEEHVEPNPPGTAVAPYTIPTIKLPNGTYIMDSRKIAQALEEQHPSPPLHLSSPYLPKLEALLPKIMSPLRGVYWPLVPARLLNPPSQAYWHQTRAKLAGMPLDQLQREQGGEPAWGKAEEFAKEVTAMLKEREDGPFFEGKEVGYADLVWAGHLLFVKRLGDDVFGELLKRRGDGGVHTGFLEAVGEWSKRNDH